MKSKSKHYYENCTFMGEYRGLVLQIRLGTIQKYVTLGMEGVRGCKQTKFECMHKGERG
jgi:DNA relaxase NicK